ncbi:MAG TPA: hypothetical protein VF594_05960, partial [Rubricoccaceae bacterium]
SFVRAVVKKGLAESGLGLSFEGAVPLDGPSVVPFDGPGPPASGEPDDAPQAPLGAGSDGDSFPALPPLPLLPPDSPRTASLPSGANPPDDRRDDRPPTPASEFAIPATMPPPDPWPDWSPALEPPARASARPPAQVYAAIPARRDAEALGDLDAEPGRTLWQLHGRYLLSPVRSGLLIIDQQAAHERILYERALASMDSGMAPRQQLLFPFTVRLAPADRALFDEILPDLAALGFDLSLAKDGTVLVRGLPADVTLGDERAVLDDLLAQYRRNASLLRLDARDNLARSLARRSAIRPGHTLRAPEARGLVDQLFACTDPFTDPSGRPTLVRLSEDEIERRFKR